MPRSLRRLVTPWTVACASLAFCAAAVAARWHADSPERRGRAEAEADIATGRPCLLGIGLMSNVGIRIDRVTGLPCRSHGCSADDASLRYVEAYNETVRAARDAGRVPDAGYVAKLTTEDAIASRLDAEGRALAPGDAPIVTADGTFRLTCVNTAPGDASSLVVADAHGERPLCESPGRPIRVALADSGTTVYVEDTLGWIASYDLPHRQMLQMHARRAATR